ncbi:MAG: response regulator transcription factor [Dehalococcoidales bacterium]|jgi:two-component system KDP operon response regulator KdpE|nr:response regulator transcription factor [Dehalococcoidales bacterium]
MKILAIEDDQNIVKSLNLILHMRWPEAELFSSRLGVEGLSLIETVRPDIIILDLGLPDISGFNVLQQMRMFSEIPVIILTVLGDEDDIVRGLELGANDYIVKPFRKAEFLARVKALVRTQSVLVSNDVCSKGPYTLELSTHKLYFNHKKIFLTKNECIIFYALLRNANVIVLYSNLAREIWGEDYPGSLEAIRVYVQRLRQKICDDSDHTAIIETKVGLGYILNVPRVMSSL